MYEWNVVNLPLSPQSERQPFYSFMCSFLVAFNIDIIARLVIFYRVRHDECVMHMFVHASSPMASVLADE
jgi:hypothetical protein